MNLDNQIIDTMAATLEQALDWADIQSNLQEEINVLRKGIDDALRIAEPHRDTNGN